MAPKKETHAQRAERLDRKALELRHREKRLSIQALMVKDPDVVPKIMDYLVSLGSFGTCDSPRTSDSAGAILGTPTKSAHGGEPDVGSTPYVQAAGNGHQAHSAPNKNFNKLDNMPLVHLRIWLKTMEPVACSDAQVKSLISRGSREESRTSLAELMEFMTDLDPSVPIFSGTVRDDIAMKTFSDHLVKVNESLGRRARDLPLPADWAKHGFYLIMFISGKAFLLNRFTNQIAPPPDDMDQGPGQHIQLEANFSENRACVRLAGSMEARLCKTIMQAAPLSLEPAMKKIKSAHPLALTEMAWPTGAVHPGVQMQGLGAQQEAFLGGTGCSLVGRSPNLLATSVPHPPRGEAEADHDADAGLDQLTFNPPSPGE